MKQGNYIPNIYQQNKQKKSQSVISLNISQEELIIQQDSIQIFEESNVQGVNLKLESEFRCQEDKLGVFKLYENILEYYEGDKKMGIIYIDFSTYLQVIRNIERKVIGFQFERDYRFFSIYNDDEENINKWHNQLKKCLNQRGFYNRFQKSKLIGKGNYADVYLYVELTNSNNSVAVKTVPKVSKMNHSQELIRNEISILRKLNHPNIIHLQEVYEDDNYTYLILEYIKGYSLYDRLNMKQSFSFSEIQQIMRGIIEGLKYLHSKNIMHRDLKPQNILFMNQYDFQIVICDFGFSQEVDSKLICDSCGTIGFMAPEVLNGNQKIDCLCDMYSLGVMFYKLLVKRYPFQNSHNSQYYQNKQGHIDFTQNSFLDLPILSKKIYIVQDLCFQMLQKNPESRVSSEKSSEHLFIIPTISQNEVLVKVKQIQQNYKKFQEQIIIKQQIQLQIQQQYCQQQLQQILQQKQQKTTKKQMNVKSNQFNPQDLMD